jgi:hypothetical protein
VVVVEEADYLVLQMAVAMCLVAVG